MRVRIRMDATTLNLDGETYLRMKLRMCIHPPGMDKVTDLQDTPTAMSLLFHISQHHFLLDKGKSQIPDAFARDHYLSSEEHVIIELPMRAVRASALMPASSYDREPAVDRHGLEAVYNLARTR